MSFRTLFALSIMLTALPALAQAAELAPGARVRVTLLDRPRLSGTILALPPGTISLETEAGATATTIPRSQIKQLEVSRGMKSGAGHGAAMGVLVLGSAGVISGGVLALKVDEETSKGGVFLLMAGSGIVLGAVLGALIGSGHHVERWETVQVP